MAAKHFIVATAGHVDHGKSALVKALTGTDPDRLPEEKARGITIDLGFAHLELPTLNPQPSTLSLGIIDVPGHEDFVKNMVAGVGAIDLALFVVAADDGWMPQTEEHLQILTYLGVQRAVVALTKIDLLESESERVTVMAQVREKLRASPFAEAPLLTTSIIRPSGLGDLKEALARVLADAPPACDLGKPRLPVDRVFTLRGIGTVVTGTLQGGTLRRGENVVIQPSGQKARIRTVQSHNRDVAFSTAGTRTALSLPDIASHSVQASLGIHRGDVVTVPELGAPSDTLDVVLEKSARLQNGTDGAARSLKEGALVQIHHGSGHYAARILLHGFDQIGPGQRALAQLRCESPVFAFAGDHFIVRDCAEQWTLAGGTVLDPDAMRKQFRSETRRRFLEQRAVRPESVVAYTSSQLARDGAVQRSGLLVKSRFSAAEITGAVTELLAQGQAVPAGEWIADNSWWQTLRKQASDAIEAGHRLHPEYPGIPLSELRAAVDETLPVPELFDVLVADLCAGDFIQAGATIRRSTHRPALPPHLQAAGNKLRDGLSAKPFEPPSRRDLAPDAPARQALRYLLDAGEAVEISEDVVLLSEALVRATRTVEAFLRIHGSATVSELRQAVGGSRRIVVPLLEHLDKKGTTRREGDRRVLR
jgi:selenocysteine-specific elongation factor